MDQKLPLKSYVAVGVMLFALFFGAGNLIFPAQLGQQAGSNVWPAAIGFFITGVGLPFLGILAMGFSGSKNLQELASRVNPVYAVLFTSALYLTIGPFFAIPRTATVSFEVGIAAPFINGDPTAALWIYSAIFFGITLLFCLKPAKIVDYVGKYLTPGIVIGLIILLAMVIFKPMGTPEIPQQGYAESAFFKGFTEGYNTMDALASLVFAIIVIHAIQRLGVRSKQGVLKATAVTGGVAAALLGVIYLGIAWLGATSVELYGYFENGGPVLSSVADHYFGVYGSALLGIVIILACLTTSIGLITACSEYFSTLIPKVNYKTFVVIFSVFSFVVSNAGLTNIITFSVPVLMLLYPLAIVTILLAFTSPLFNHAKIVYVASTAAALCIGVVDGLKTFFASIGMDNPGWFQSIVTFLDENLPLYSQGLGWVLPVLIVMVITGVIARITNASSVTVSGKEANANS